MIIVRFLGGAKKSFFTDHLEIDRSDISISDLLEILLSIKPEHTLSLDVENILIAVNGVDSSAMDGKSTLLRNDDVVSIIPVIHGGSSKRILFPISKKTIQIMEIKGHKDIDVVFLDDLRNNFTKLKIQAVSSTGRDASSVPAGIFRMFFSVGFGLNFTIDAAGSGRR